MTLKLYFYLDGKELTDKELDNLQICNPVIDQIVNDIAENRVTSENTSSIEAA